MVVRGIPHPLHDPAASACWRVGGLLDGASLSLNPQPFPQSLTQAATLQPQGRRAPALPLALQSSPTCLDCLTGVPVREGPSLSSVNDGSPDHAMAPGRRKQKGEELARHRIRQSGARRSDVPFKLPVLVSTEFVTWFEVRPLPELSWPWVANPVLRTLEP